MAQVSSEAPRFKTVEASGDLTVVILLIITIFILISTPCQILPPHSPPQLSPQGSQAPVTQTSPGARVRRWRVGDMLEVTIIIILRRLIKLLQVNCTSPESSPPAKLRYFINNQMVSADCRVVESITCSKL